MSPNLGQAGVLQVIPPAELERQLRAKAEATASAAASASATQDVSQLAGYIKAQYEIFRNHRNTAAGWSERMLDALRAFNGQYSPTKLNEIKQWGGSEIYARLIAQKCRAASSLLRDIYLGPDRPWALRPSPDPKIPDGILKRINEVIMTEAQTVRQYTGQPPSPEDLQERRRALIDSARDAAKKRAKSRCRDSEDKIEQILREGGFYRAFAEFLVDLTIFPFACIKGPVVRIQPKVVWPEGGGQPTIEQIPTLTWQRVSPFDLWFTPGVSDIANANVIEKLRVTRAELNELLDLPGYNQEELRKVLEEYGRGGLYDNWDTTDAERALLESRENPAWNRSGMISMMEFNGNVLGSVLQDYGLAVPDPLRDYHVQAWVVGSHVIKCNLSPSPRQRHPYFLTSFEKVPGTPIGNGLTDLLSDVQEATNATLRSLVNNMGMASGPQVVIDVGRLAPGSSDEQMYPWKRWYVKDAYGQTSSKPPIQFFQPQSNAQQLVEVYREFVSIADDVSAIPKYVGGNGAGNAGRTASGLAMLMGNASKILQTVSANVDRDVLEQALMQLSDLILLTDTSGLLTGEEDISVQGVNVAIQRETLRQRQIEFLQATNNPVDLKIVGVKGRSEVLRSVSSTIGMEGSRVVPPEDVIEKMEEENKKQAANSSTQQAVEAGVQKGVQAGVARITTEMTAGAIASRARMPQPSGPNGGVPGNTSDPSMDLAADAGKAQGDQPSKPDMSMGPQTHLMRNQPGPNARSNARGQPSGGFG